MTKLEKIERDIETLSAEELRKLSEWLAAYKEELWDQQIEDDIKAGRLDSVADNVLADHAAGRTKPL